MRDFVRKGKILHHLIEFVRIYVIVESTRPTSSGKNMQSSRMSKLIVVGLCSIRVREP